MLFDRLTHPIRRSARVWIILLSTFLLSALLVAGAAAQGESSAAGNAAVLKPGTVFVMTNDAAGNAVQTYARAADGTLSPADSYPTGGLGTGSGLGSQGALITSNDGRFLFAVNAGSNEITSFRMRRGELVWADTVSSNGEMPISLTHHGRRLWCSTRAAVATFPPSSCPPMEACG